ncbi:caspase family protein [Scytonema sp. PCC 10023]|uniref:caspase family protein n=1 Tax=Scytonema sp. PCC 10023 TaxID=1680591 RepID=UPI0039C64CDB
MLIGIDNYLSNPKFANLKGCVRDITLVEDYLQNVQQQNTPHIYKLLAPNPDASNHNNTNEPLPTYENIVKAFDKITQEASSGSQVYIHYSGHGAFATTIYPEIKQDHLDEAIVPMDIGESQGRYLRDVELATLIKRMTDKGLIVTIVLDSCHSGGATRGDDFGIRGPEDGSVDDTPRSQDSLVAPYEQLIQNWRLLTQGANTNRTLGEWLPQSTEKNREYVLLAACRPSESAHEYNVDGKQKHGALTYWMIDTLKSSVSALTYKSLYDRVTAKIQSRFPQKQIPMLIGESNRSVFGSDRIQQQYAVNVLEIVEQDAVPKRVRLNAGLVNGLGVGALFAIYPVGARDFTNKEDILAIVEVKQVNAADAWAEVSENLGRGKIEMGAQAVMRSAPINLVREVRLFKKQVGHKDNELPPELVDKQDKALQAVEEAIKESGWLKLVSDDNQTADYQVAINKQGEYEICVGTPIQNLRPPIEIGAPDAALKVVQRLVHLAKYQAVRELDNPSSYLTNGLEVELLMQENWQPGLPLNPQPFPDPKKLKIVSGGYALLRIKNVSPLNLNIVILDIEPTWAISQIEILGIGQQFYQLQSGEQLELPLQLVVPDRDGYESVEEVLKVFAMVGAADFGWLELPSLDEEITSRAGSRRGDSPLEQLLAAIGSDVDKPPTNKRAAKVVIDPNQEWTTKHVTVNLTAQ